MNLKLKILSLLLIVSLSLGMLSGCDGALEKLFGDNSAGGASDSTDQTGGTDEDSDSDGNDSDSGTDGGREETLYDKAPTLPEEPEHFDDPYVGVDKSEFYENYSPATSYLDSYYRTEHGLMSGSIDPQDEEATISDNRPMKDGMYIRNISMLYSADGNTFYLLDSDGEIAKGIYRGGAYVTLEEVAAYVYAFGEIPKNHSESKKTKPYESEWGIYLRVNHTRFSGDTSRYPYEPELPRIDGCGGDLTYYEMDIGTTGTTCDPSYNATDYNNGSKITRGAARIVYARYDRNGDKIIDITERYVFYTNNHYNDFREYLGYLGGWGELFGNISGGGALSSKSNYAPTPYVSSLVFEFVPRVSRAEVALVFIIKEEIYA